MKSKVALTLRIDQLAVAACQLMNDTERDAFFAYQEARDISGDSAPRRYARRNTYYKGENKGKLKDVYAIDGSKFNELWKLLRPYVLKSVARSYYKTHINEDAYEEVFEIRALTFQALRYFGPTPCKTNFSNYFKLVVNNVLTNSARQRNHTITTVSIQEPVGDTELTLADICPDSVDYESSFLFWSSISSEHKEAVKALTSGEKFSTVLKQHRVNRSKFREVLSNYCI